MKKMLVILVSLFFTVMLVSVSYSADAKPAEAKKPTLGEVKTSGVVYLDYIYDVDDLGKGEGFNRFDIERAYLSFDSNIAENAKVRVRTDVYNNTKSVSFTSGDGKDVKVGSYYDGWTVRIKNAYVDLKMIPMTTVSFGVIGTPWIPAVEGAWGYRFVKPTLTDAEKLMASADFGVSLDFKIPQNYGDIVLAVVNGNGYSKIEDDKYKDIVPMITITPLPNDAVFKKLALSGYYYLGKKASGDESVDKTRGGGMVSFGYDFINVGGEFDVSKDVDVNGMGFSGFGEVKLGKFLPAPLNNLGVIARLDSWDPNTDKEDDAHSIIIAGLTYNVTKNVRSVLDLQQTSYQATDKDSTSQIMAQFEVKF